MFDSIADEYDRRRPAYPDELLDRACHEAGLTAGDPVLEIGCGSGQLTQSLLARGLCVTAVEPGPRLIERARRRLSGLGKVRFVNHRFEEAGLEPGHFRAAFSATAIHWVDPEVGWQKIAGALAAHGSLALLSFFGLDDPASRQDQEGLRGALQTVVPEVARDWPTSRDLGRITAGAAERRENISAVWAWLGGYDVARASVPELFGPAQLTVKQFRVKHTATELSGFLGTMSFWAGLSESQRNALVEEIRVLERRLGRPLQSSIAACLVTARRRAPGPPRGGVS